MSDPKSNCKTCNGNGWLYLGSSTPYGVAPNGDKGACSDCQGTGQAPEKPLPSDCDMCKALVNGTAPSGQIVQDPMMLYEQHRTFHLGEPVREDSKQDTGSASTPDDKPFENVSQPHINPEQIAADLRRLAVTLNPFGLSQQTLDNGKEYRCCDFCGLSPLRLAELFEALSSQSNLRRGYGRLAMSSSQDNQSLEVFDHLFSPMASDVGVCSRCGLGEQTTYGTHPTGTGTQSTQQDSRDIGSDTQPEPPQFDNVSGKRSK